jgi:hypothetical protein
MAAGDTRHHIGAPPVRQSCAAQNLKRFPCTAKSARIYGNRLYCLNLPRYCKEASLPVVAA